MRLSATSQPAGAIDTAVIIAMSAVNGWQPSALFIFLTR
jgi:hypothetical protein